VFLTSQPGPLDRKGERKNDPERKCRDARTSVDLICGGGNRNASRRRLLSRRIRQNRPGTSWPGLLEKRKQRRPRPRRPASAGRRRSARPLQADAQPSFVAASRPKDARLQSAPRPASRRPQPRPPHRPRARRRALNRPRLPSRRNKDPFPRCRSALLRVRDAGIYAQCVGRLRRVSKRRRSVSRSW
jgi:hypothetical protein